MVERYIKEYANACKREIEENALMEISEKSKAVHKIDKAVVHRNFGAITADEAIRMILERFS